MTLSASPLEPRARAGRLARFGHGLRIIGAWWFSKDAPLAWFMLASLFALQFAGSKTIMMMTKWEKGLFDLLQSGHGSTTALLVNFIFIVMLMTANSLASGIVISFAGLRWRTWQTAHYQRRWLSARAYYRIQSADMVDNPDQRMAEDVTLMTESLLGMVTGFVFSLLNLWQFSKLLMTLSAPLQVHVFGWQLALPGDMAIYGFLYAIASSVFVVLVGKPLVAYTIRQQHFEADYRFALIHVRRKAEQIALTGAEPTEAGMLTRRFDILRRNMQKLILARTGLGTTQMLISQLSPMVPILLLLPRFFARGLTIGDVIQGRSAFTQMAGALSWFMQSYGAIAALIAIVARLRAFEDALDAVPEPVHDAQPPRPVALAVEGLAMALPDGAPLAAVPDWQVNAGQRWVVRGPSGAGKSTLLRTLAGLWPHARGRVALADGAMFLPQRAYLPLGTLRQAVCFPASPDAFADAAIGDALTTFGLAHILPRLDAEEAWEDVLSPGEQQRLAMARVLLHRPAMLVMDEATSALDAQNAAHAYRTVIATIPGVTIVSVVHDDKLEQFHDHILRLDHGTAVASAFSA